MISTTFTVSADANGITVKVKQEGRKSNDLEKALMQNLMGLVKMFFEVQSKELKRLKDAGELTEGIANGAATTKQRNGATEAGEEVSEGKEVTGGNLLSFPQEQVPEGSPETLGQPDSAGGRGDELGRGVSPDVP